MKSEKQLKTVVFDRDKQAQLWVDTISSEEKSLITRACKISRLRRPAFYKNAILSASKKIISDYQASLASKSPSPDQEAGESSLSVEQ
jgi:hypothetical protein